MQSFQGHFLVASPQLADGNFNRSVVLLIKHDEEGAFGLVMNRPSDNKVRDLWRMVAEEEIDRQDRIYVGGPVSGPLVALHCLKSAAEAEVLRGIYFAAHKSQLGKVLHSKRPFRFFTGYAGWAAGQLEGEMHVGGWLTCPATKELAFHEADDLWERVLARIGQDFIGTAIKVRHVPDDPSLN